MTVLLKDKGIINNIIAQTSGGIEISLENKNLTIDYNSPLLQAQQQTELENLQQFIQMFVGLLGTNVLAIFDLVEVVFYTADRFYAGMQSKLIFLFISNSCRTFKRFFAHRAT